ncbi:MAG: hypothetical protein ACTSRI_02735 [Promethearchaeota archaeon]
MVEKIEISVFKIFIAIGSILSMFFIWAFVIVTTTYIDFLGDEWIFTTKGEYDFLGNGKIEGQTIDTFLFGVCYIIGFFLVLINIKFDGKLFSKNIEILGIGLIFLGIIGYATSFLMVIDNLNRKNIPDITIDINYGFDFGFYMAIIVGLFAITELACENKKIFHLVLTLSKT